jgi:hypothetical protein
MKILYVTRITTKFYYFTSLRACHMESHTWKWNAITWFGKIKYEVQYFQITRLQPSKTLNKPTTNQKFTSSSYYRQIWKSHNNQLTLSTPEIPDTVVRTRNAENVNTHGLPSVEEEVNTTFGISSSAQSVIMYHVLFHRRSQSIAFSTHFPNEGCRMKIIDLWQ